MRKNSKYIEYKFNASVGWFCRFKIHYHLSRRVQTHVAQKVAEDYKEQIDRFVGRLRKTR